MIFLNFSVALTAVLPLLPAALSRPAEAPPRRRCAYGDACWPSAGQWASFNTSVCGRLVAAHPSAAVCHDALFDEDGCAEAREKWFDSRWRTDQVGAYSAILWEMGDDVCPVNGTRESPCGPGIVPHYAVAVQEVADIEKAVRLADKHDLRLVVKNTGHDHLGRSSGKGALSVWTHNLKGREWHDAFVPRGAPYGTKGIPAVTLQAGEQWVDVYRDAAEQKRIVVGGMARTVGAAGGYLLGGGHSPFAHFYGLAADNLLEMGIVTPAGEHKIINAHEDPDYFWAVRGGGGSAWGVVTHVTYKTHPDVSHVQVGFVQLNASDEASHRAILKDVFTTLPRITAAGYTGYAIIPGGFLGVFLQPNGTNATFAEAFAPLYKTTKLPGVSGQVGSFDFPSWLSYTDTFLMDPNIGTNVQDASRLATDELLLNNTDALVDLVMENPDLETGFNFIGKVNPAARAETAVNPQWDLSNGVLSFSIDWAEDAPEDEKRAKRLRLVEMSNKYDAVAGPESGTYINEANPYEPEWQRVFWGTKYERLLEIKRRIDPTNLFVCNRCVGTDIVLEP